MSSSAGTEGVASAAGSIGAGAAAGAMVGGPVGAAVGAAIGAVAGAFGLGASRAKRKAAKLKRQVRALNNVILRREAIVEYIAVSASLQVGIIGSGAGTGRSSGGFGVLASSRTQVAANLKSNKILYQKGTKIDKLERRAQKNSLIQSGIMEGFEAAAGVYGKGGFGGPTKKVVPRYSVNEAGYFQKSFPK